MRCPICNSLTDNHDECDDCLDAIRVIHVEWEEKDLGIESYFEEGTDDD